jgi:hypothetical protein
MAAAASDLLTLVRKRVNVNAVHSEARKPFRFLLCGDPGLVAEFRALLLVSREDANVPLDAASTLETIDPERRSTIMGPDVRCAIFFGRPGDLGSVTADALRSLRVPVFALTVDPLAAPGTPPTSAPLPGDIGEYVVPRLDRDALRGRVFPHIVDRCKGVEVAVGRRLPAMRETVAAKLTRDAASSALKIAAASAVVDHVPILGIVLGAVASAGDMVAITGIQIVLMMQIGATYGKDRALTRTLRLHPRRGRRDQRRDRIRGYDRRRRRRRLLLRTRPPHDGHASRSALRRTQTRRANVRASTRYENALEGLARFHKVAVIRRLPEHQERLRVCLGCVENLERHRRVQILSPTSVIERVERSLRIDDTAIVERLEGRKPAGIQRWTLIEVSVRDDFQDGETLRIDPQFAQPKFFQLSFGR